MDKIAVCAIFKDEAPYLLEWLAFHRMIGVDLFVLYDNGSSDGGSDLIRASSFARNVTLIDWPDRPGQLSAYNHFRVNHAPRFTWVAFIDIDEFIMPLAGSSIRDILMRPAYAPYAQILLQWLVFGPSGHDRRPDGPGDRKLHAPSARSGRCQPPHQVDRADRQVVRHRLHAACRRMQRSRLQYARRDCAALRDPADRVPRGHGGEPLLHQVARTTGSSSAAAAVATRSSPIRNGCSRT